ncbi:TPA: phosphoserine phosphatase SerB [Streptococcus agalactiae]
MIKGLLVMDVDSTLIMEEAIDLLAIEAGVGKQVAALTDTAMRGELDFEEALKKRVALLKGLPVTILTDILSSIHFTPGVYELIKECHKRQMKVGLVSGGFHETIDILAKQLQVDYVKANRLGVKGGFLTGEVEGEIVTKEVKKIKLKEWASENHLDLSQTIAMGDGANDLPMIKSAGVGIAFCAKPIVREEAAYQINEKNLLKVFDIIDANEN